MAFTCVVKETILSDTSDQYVRKAVIVIVAYGYAHSVHLDVKSGRPGHIRKRTVAIVAIELQRASLALMAWPVHSIDQQDILPAVSVIVEKSAAGAHGLRE